MKREQLVRLGLGGGALLGLGAGVLLAACSAGGNGTRPTAGGGNGGNVGGSGGILGTGSGNFGNGSGGDVTFFGGGSPGGGAGGTGGADAGGGGTGGGVSQLLEGHKGPAHTDNCPDKSAFANPGGSNRILYPYDGTVFPRGLAGPLLMWDAKADKILLEMSSKDWSYTDCPSTPDGVRYQIPSSDPNDVWGGAGSWSGGTGDPLTIKVTAHTSSGVVGPVTVTVKFALATLKGAIFYNTYGSKLLPGGVQNGAVLKLMPGDSQPSVFLTADQGVPTAFPFGPCRSCHALSANGKAMTANYHTYPGAYVSELYDVSTGSANRIQQNIPEAGFAALYPDGSRIMTNGPPNPSISIAFPTSPGDVPALVQAESKMLDPKTGQPIATNGWTAKHAQMPMFSPDGLHIVYNDADQGPQTTVNTTSPPGGTTNVHGHTLWVQDFDPSSNTFSNARKIYESADKFPGWPFFTPDSKQVVFALLSRSDFASQVPEILGPTLSGTPWPPTPAWCASNPNQQSCTGFGSLMLVDVASLTATKLDIANGYKGGQSYLPAGEARDNNLEFYPTVSPFPGGGFAWVFFSSKRTYGNNLAQDMQQPTQKLIWVSALTLGAPPGTDPSNPPFVLPGQEIGSGNIRAFAALEPCKEDGLDCTSGFDCCLGFCTVDSTGKGHCGKPPPAPNVPQCAHVDEKCTTDADCCTGANNGANGQPLTCLATAGSKYCGIIIQ